MQTEKRTSAYLKQKRYTPDDDHKSLNYFTDGDDYENAEFLENHTDG